MRIGVSPYHLTTREAPAMAALLIASEVVTAVPGPVGAHAAVAARSAAERAPAFRELVRSWAWSEQLWQEGVLRPDADGRETIDEALAVLRGIAIDPRYAPLRRLMRDETGDEDLYLNAVAGDLLKGGPDPGVLIPISAAIDRVCATHACAVARSHPQSVAQRAEMALMHEPRTLVLPVFTQADALRILHARDVLQEPLDTLREQLASLAAHQAAPGLDEAAAVYARAFEQNREDLFDDAAHDEVRAIDSAVSITMGFLPADAVLRSSLTAIGTMGLDASEGTVEDPSIPVLRDVVEDRSFLALTLRTLGQASR